MVVDDVDQLFGGLADPTRRDILRRCAIDAPSVSQLAEAYPMSFAAVPEKWPCSSAPAWCQGAPGAGDARAHRGAAVDARARPRTAFW
jgi:hypothetical protein